MQPREVPILQPLLIPHPSAVLFSSSSSSHPSSLQNDLVSSNSGWNFKQSATSFYLHCPSASMTSIISATTFETLACSNKLSSWLNLLLRVPHLVQFFAKANIKSLIKSSISRPFCYSSLCNLSKQVN